MYRLIDKLNAKGHFFDFFQAVFLLEEYFQKQHGASDPLTSGKIRFAPDTDITFPASDVKKVHATQSHVEFILSFMGLVGVSSPLPQYFSEYVAQHEHTGSALYDFLTIFNHRFYTLFYRAWKKYRFLTASRDRSFTHKLKFLAGILNAKTTDMRFVAYTGILAHPNRSAEGLRTILSDFYGNIPVGIEEFFPRRAPLKEKRQMGVNALLGKNTIIGDHIEDRCGKIRIVLGPLNRENYESFLSGSPRLKEITTIVSHYSADPLDFDIQLTLQATDLVPVVLGNNDASLGKTSSLGSSSQTTGIHSVVINPFENRTFQ